MSSVERAPRNPNLDILRGVAILGILVANISSFAFTDPLDLETTAGTTGWDRFAEYVTLAFVNGRFRSMLAILFGVGLYLQYRSREAKGTWPKDYRRRILILALIGVVHGLFIWPGDILFFYALVAFVVSFLVDRAMLTQKLVAGSLAFIALLWGCGIAALMLTMPSGEGMSDPMMKGLLKDYALAYTQGTYLDQLRVRFVFTPLFQVMTILLFGLGVTTLFLIGTWIGRSGVLESPHRHPRALRLMIGLGVAFGLLPGVMLATYAAGRPESSSLSLFNEVAFGPFQALFYLAAIAAVVDGRPLGWVAESLRQVGRMALTNYLLQSVICSVIFYSWGLRWMDRLTFSQALLVVPLVWAVNILFSRWWLTHHTMGPVEWLWRRWADREAVPLRRPEPSGSPAS
jgi:uncharacterized protein